MLEDLLGRVLFLLPIETLVFIAIVAVLWRTGTLQRTSKTLNLWLSSVVKTNTLVKEYEFELEKLSSKHDTMLDDLYAQTLKNLLDSYNLEEFKLRNELTQIIVKEIEFLHALVLLLAKEKVVLNEIERVNKDKITKDDDERGEID